jgi:TetR/AcrR family transcriptional repressor of nem operon
MPSRPDIPPQHSSGTDGPASAERLLDAADRLMYVRGYHDVGVAELCREADVRTGSFYYYFPSKEALAAAMLERAWARTDERIFAPAFDDPELGVLEAIGRYSELLEAHLRATQDRTGVLVGCRFGNFATETAPHLPLVQRATHSALTAMIGRFVDLIERSRGVSPAVDVPGDERGDEPGEDARDDVESLATSLVAQMEGLMVIAKACGDPAVIRRLVPAARRLLSPGAR